MPKFVRRLSSQEMQKLVHETYAAHYVLLNLGFSPDEVFAGTANVRNWDPPGICANVELHAQGKKFIYTLRALVPGDETRFARFWLDFAAAQPKRDRSELDALVHGSDVWREKAALLVALELKGFIFPATEREKLS